MRQVTVLKLLREAAKLATVALPNSAINSRDGNSLKLLRTLHDLGSELREQYTWPQLVRRGTITLVSGKARYPLPADFDSFVRDTMWLSSENRPQANLSPFADFEFLQRSNLGTIDKAVSIQGHTFDSFYVHPSEGEGVYSFLYNSRNWVRPSVWMQGKSFNMGQFCWYDGSVYQAINGGTAGATAPTHDAGSETDGGVMWRYYEEPYDEVKSDEDTTVFDPDLMIYGITARFVDGQGLDASQLEARFMSRLERVKPRQAPTPTINMGSKLYQLPQGTIPEGGWYQ